MNTPTPATERSVSTPIEYVGEQVAAVTESTRQRVKENPATASLISFGSGFAIGMAIAAMIGQSESKQRSSFANQISNQVMSGLSGWMPKSFRS